MIVEHMGARRCWPLRIGLSALAGLASLGAAAQVTPLRYQHCETEKPASNAIHRLETNYRYPPAATTRSLQGVTTHRCEPAWVQSQDIFDATTTCNFYVSGCSLDASNGCTDNPEDWYDLDFLGAVQWSQFFEESALPGMPEVKLHSGLQTVEQWTRHRWWGWASPARYAYLGVVERSFIDTPSAYPRCYGMAYLVGLFNGVWNTKKAAESGMKAIQANAFIGPSHQGAPIKYQLFYNQTGCSRSGVACIEDLAEVFIQRSAELDGLLERRWEYFWEQVTGRAATQDSFTTSLLLRVQNIDRAMALWVQALDHALMAKITALAAQMLASPPTAADTGTHVANLISHGQQGYRAVLVAHSQGNLFVNAAYEGYLAHSREAGAAAGQDTGYVAAQIVHVAPASATLRGPSVLAEIDIVINGLRYYDGTPVASNTLSRDVMPPSPVDKSGHRLVESYLDPQRRAREDIRQLIIQAMDLL